MAYFRWTIFPLTRDRRALPERCRKPIWKHTAGSATALKLWGLVSIPLARANFRFPIVLSYILCSCLLSTIGATVLAAMSNIFLRVSSQHDFPTCNIGRRLQCCLCRNFGIAMHWQAYQRASGYFIPKRARLRFSVDDHLNSTLDVTAERNLLPRVPRTLEPDKGLPSFLTDEARDLTV